MNPELSKHKLAYFILLLGLLFVVVSFLAFWPNSFLQRLVIVFLAVFYVSWGIFTHAKNHDLSRKIVQEYIAVALLASGMLFIITF